MMKKRIPLLIAIMLIFVLSGCARINVDINIKQDGKVDMSMMYAFIEAAAEGADMLSDDDIKDLTDEGWDYAVYDEDGYKGYTLSIRDQNIKDLMAEVNDSESDLGVGESMSIKLEDGKYIFECDLLGGEEAEMMNESKEYFTMYGGYMTVVLHVPEPPIYSNATYVSEDGKTLTWDLLEMPPYDKIHAEFKLSRQRPYKMIGAAAGALVALLVIIVVILLVRKSSKDKKAKAAAAAAGAGLYAGQNGQPAQPYPNQNAGGPVYTYGSQLSTPTQAQTSAPVQQGTQPTQPGQQLPSQTAPQPLDPAQNAQVSYCPQCGAKITAPSSYCQQCGAKLF